SLYIADDDLPPGAVVSSFLPRTATLKLAGAKSKLTATGFFDTGLGPANFAESIGLTVGNFAVLIPKLTRQKNGAFTYKGQGVSLTAIPSKIGSSRGIFKLTIARDLTGYVAADAQLHFRFYDGVIDGSGIVTLKKGNFRLGRARGELASPSIFLFSLNGAVSGGGKDGFSLKAGFGGLGATYSVTIPAASFKKKGGAFTAGKGAGGVASARLDYDKEYMQVKVAGVDLGALPDGPQPVVVKITVGGDTRTTVVRLVKRGKKLTY